MGEIVQFPKPKINSPAQSMDEVVSNIENIRREHIDQFLEIYMPILFQRAYDEGFDLTDEKCNYINSLFVESFRSALLMSIGIDHELQDFAKESMEAWIKEIEESEKET